MKPALFFFIALTTISVSHACTQEAQFASVVKEIIQVPDEPYSCIIKLDLRLNQRSQSYRSSSVCPLDIDEVSSKGIYTTRCFFEVGDRISGYLVKLNDRIELD